MTIQRDPDSILAAWLEDGPVRLPDQTRRAIAVTTRTNRQTQRSIWVPRRFLPMNGYARVALAAVAVVAVAFGGLYLIKPGDGGTVGGPNPSASPAASPTSTPMPFPTDTSGGIPVAPGRYALDLPTRNATSGMPVILRVGFTVPSGWEKNQTPTILWNASDHRTFGFFTVDNIYTDPCTSTELVGLRDPKLGPTASDLVGGLQQLPGFKVTTRDVTVGGFPGKQLELMAPAAATGCIEDTTLALWASPEGAPVRDAAVYISAGERGIVTVVDVGGARLVMNPGSSASADLQAILDSVQIEAITTAPSAQPGS